jgi:hypothetical protein
VGNAGFWAAAAAEMEDTPQQNSKTPLKWKEDLEMNDGSKWERIQRSHDRETLRLPVPGGWLYLVNEFTEMHGIMGQLMAFVPKPQAVTRKRDAAA